MVLNQITFQIIKGDIIILHGEVGSGKSTLCRILAGLISEDDSYLSGKIDKPPRIPLLLQNVNSQILTFRVDEEIALPLSFKKVDRKMRSERVNHLLKEYRITSLKKRDPKRLSSGEKQLVVLLSVLASDNEFIILDEPTSSLDEENFNQFIDGLRTLKRKGITMLIVDHNPIRYEGLANRIMKLKNGQIILDTEFSKEVIKNYYSGGKVDNTNNAIKLRQLNFTIQRGDIHRKVCLEELKTGLTLITGKNGSGKTTLLENLAGIIKNDDLKLEGNIPMYLPQDITQFFWQGSVKEEFDGLDLPEWIKLLRNQSPFELSTGQQRKIALQIGLASNRNLLLDEPSQGLDPDEFKWLITTIISRSKDRWVVVTSNHSALKSVLREICFEEIQL